MSARARCILVMGMHRSGTSCVAGLLDAIGVSLGPEGDLMKASPDNPRGYFENMEFNRLLVELLEDAGADWWKIGDFDVSKLSGEVIERARSRLERFLHQFGDDRIFALKDPRLCLLLPALREVFPDPVFLHVARSPVEVALSLSKRNGFGLAEGVALWETYNRHAFAATVGERRLVVDYADLVARVGRAVPELVANLHALGATDLSVPEPHVLSRVVDRALHREKSTDEDTDSYLTDAQRLYWGALKAGRVPDPVETEESSAHRRRMLMCLEAHVAAQLERWADLQRDEASREAARSDIRDDITALRAHIDDVAASMRGELARAAAENQALTDRLRELAPSFAPTGEIVERLRSDMSDKHDRLEAILLKASHKPSFMCRFRRSLSRAKYLWDQRNDPLARTLLDRISPDFDRGYYYAMNADVRRTCIDPRVHFVKFGWQEGRKPHPRRTAEDLLARYPEIRRVGARA